jgi:hypothetical protein
MKHSQAPTTRFPIESDLAADNVKRLSELINEVYDDAESGMWKRRGTRTTPAEVERLLRARALILAEIEGRVVGSVNVNCSATASASSGCSSPPTSTAARARELVPELATECDYTVWYKSLVAQSDL